MAPAAPISTDTGSIWHDGGWAYKVNGVFSEPFPTHAEALAAAQAAAGEQEIPGHEETIEYEDDKGKWHDRGRGGAVFLGPSPGVATNGIVAAVIATTAQFLE